MILGLLWDFNGFDEVIYFSLGILYVLHNHKDNLKTQFWSLKK